MSPDTQGHPCSFAGATILRVTPALRDNPSGKAAAHIALALPQSGARAIVTGEDGPLVNELHDLGGGFVRMPNDALYPLCIWHNTRAR
jgi:hypothetical protein